MRYFNADGRQSRLMRQRQPLYPCFCPPPGIDKNTPSPEDRKVTTYKQEVEDETLTCGTGCVAAALSVATVNRDSENTIPP